MKRNVGNVDRTIRLGLAVALLIAPFATNVGLFQSSTGTVISVLMALVLIATSAKRFCPLYRILGIQTCKL